MSTTFRPKSTEQAGIYYHATHHAPRPAYKDVTNILMKPMMTEVISVLQSATEVSSDRGTEN